MTKTSQSNAALVIGGGVAGARVARELADSGLAVYLVEQTPSLGGVTAQLGYMFPHHNCLLCRGTADHGFGCTRPSISPDFLDFNRPSNLHILTLGDVEDITDEAGRFTATVRVRPRYVEPSLCINCDRCSQICPAEVTDRYSLSPLGAGRHKAAYKPDWRAIPNAYVIDKGSYCTDCGKCQEICPTRAINLEQVERRYQLKVGAVVLATGYQLHDPTVSAELGYGRVPNVLTGFDFERMANPAGPSDGHIRRPSDGAAPKRIAWLQCVGSRDKTHDYCSAFCCMYATRQAALAREALPEAECEIFFMDDRVFGKQFLDTYESMRRAHNLRYTRCRLFDVREDKATGEVLFRYLADGQSLQETRFDLMVLSIGAEPPSGTAALAAKLGLSLNPHGFVQTDEIMPGVTARPGIFACGCTAAPKDICDATAEASAVAGQVITLLQGKSPANGHALGRTAPATIRVEEPRSGIFICRCAEEIGGIIDVDTLVDYAGRLPGVIHAQAVDFGCLPEGQAEIERSVSAHDLNRIIMGACTPRTHQPLFEDILRRTENDPDLLEFVGLREFCTWPHRHQPGRAAHKAQEMLRRAALRAERLESAPQEELTCQQTALVVGGGLSGLTAALHLADRDVSVHLVEKTGRLGGNFARIRYLPGGAAPQVALDSLLRKVEASDRITIHLSTEVAGTTGRTGDFQTQLRPAPGSVASDGNGAVQMIRHGATILATGGQEYRGSAYLLGHEPHVLTQLDFENELADHPERAAEWRSVVMINCVGPWSEGQPTAWRCSRNCCLQVMKNALRLKAVNPACQVVVLYRETMTTAFNETLYTEARRQGVLFVRYAPEAGPDVTVEQGQLVVRITDLSLGHRIELQPDRLALAVALLPNPDNSRLASLMQIDVLESGFFAETEPKQRMTEFHRSGVYLCGLAHGPKPSQLNIAQALTAAEQAARLLAPGTILTRRAVAVVDETHCMGCLTCVRTCPYGVPVIDAKRQGKGSIMGASYIDPTNCQGCGTCPSECPGKAISLNYYRDEQVMVALGSWEA